MAHPIPDGTAFPAKTRAYGKLVRYEIARSMSGGRSSQVLPRDQRTRGGVQWAYDTRIAAQNRCAELNEIRADLLVDKGSDASLPPPAFFEGQAFALEAAGDYIAAAIAYSWARRASVGANRRERYEEQAKRLRALDVKRFDEAYPS